MNRSEKRTSRAGVQVGLWVVAAAGALLLGLTAVGSIGSDLGGAGDGTQPLAAEEIEARLAGQAATDAAAPPPADRPVPAPAPPEPPASAAPVVVPAGPAGTVLARCTDGVPQVVSVNPAQGFEREDDDDLAPGQIGLDGDDVDVHVTLSCADGTPSGQVTTVTEDD